MDDCARPLMARGHQPRNRRAGRQPQRAAGRVGQDVGGQDVKEAMSQDTLTGVERFFSPEEIIVSKTDLQGRITYANDVFLRIADYQEDEVLGKPHNVIRHPDMPRCVFRLLWDTVAAGQEIFAYVVNRTKNGDHYWVLAHVTPTLTPDGSMIGFHSCRRVPSRPAVAAVSGLYRTLRGIEMAAENRKDGMAEAGRALSAHLAGIGKRYDQFMFSLIQGA